MRVADLVPTFEEIGEPALPDSFAEAFARVTAEADKQAGKEAPGGQG